MRIVIFTDTFLPQINGVVTSVVNAIKKFNDKGHKVLIFTSIKKDSIKTKFGKNIFIEYLPQMNLINYPDFKLAYPDSKIINKIKRFKPDIIHSHMPSILGWQALLISKFYKIPIVSTYHTMLPDFLEHTPLPKRFTRTKLANKMTWAYTRKYYNLCDAVITPSPIIKKELINHGITPKIYSISNGVNLSKFKLNSNIKKENIILHTGRISYEKRIDLIIESFKLISKDAKDWKLVIVGRGPDLEKLKKISGNLLNKNIFFTGAIPNESLPNIYSKSEIFVTMSTIETEGIVILEAMSCKLPILGVNVRAIPILVKNNKNGYIVSENNVKDFSKKLLKLTRDSKLRKKFGNFSYKQVQKYSLDKSNDKLEKLYLNIISQNGKKNNK